MADPKKTDDQLAAEKAAAEKEAADKAAAEAAAKEAADKAAAEAEAKRRPDFVVAPDISINTPNRGHLDTGAEVKVKDFATKADFDDLVRRGAIVKG